MSKIALSGDASGTGTFTIASPNSNNNRTLTLPDNTGTIITTGATAAVTQAMLETLVVPVGVGQTWQNVAGSRAFNTTYTNSTGRPITVLVSAQSNASGGGSANMSGLVNGTTITLVLIEYYWSSVVVAFRNSINFVVPSGATYAVNVSNTSTLGTWFELR